MCSDKQTKTALYNIDVPYLHILYCFSGDIPLAQVKLGELPGWLMRRSKNPIDWSRAIARGWWRWRYAYLKDYFNFSVCLSLLLKNVHKKKGKDLSKFSMLY